MKVRASVRRICDKCKIVRRRGVVFVVCADPRHKQRQGWRRNPYPVGKRSFSSGRWCPSGALCRRWASGFSWVHLKVSGSV